MQRDRDLTGTEVGAKVAADLTDRVDDVLAHFLRDLLQLLFGELVQVLGFVDVLEQVGHFDQWLRYAMKSVIW